MRRLLPALCGLVLVAGCGRVPPAPLAAGDFRLYEAASTSSSQLVAVINPQSHTTESRLPLGALSPDGTHLYTVSSNNTLQDIDPHSGAVVRTLRLPGSFSLPAATLGGIPGGLSQNGRWLVLQTGGAQTSSHMVLIDTAQLKVTTRIDLEGTFEFDAIDNTGMRLYLIEYTNITQGYYRVRVYEVGAGLGSYTVIDKGGNGIPEPMTGVRLSGVFSPDGQWLYSVYARQGSGAFVHALNLTMPFAFCLDLPDSGSPTDAFHWSLALTVDGKHLYAANGAMGSVTQIDNLDNYNPTIVRTRQVGAPGATANALVQNVEAKELGANGAVLSHDGSTLVTTGATGLLWIDTATLRARGSQLTKWTVWSLLASPDGSRVYALNDAGAIAELSMSDGTMGATFNPAVGSPIGLLRVEAG